MNENRKVPKLRFPGFTEEWEQHKYSDVINLLSGQDFEPSEYNDGGNGIPYMTGASCIVDGETVVNRWTETPKCIAYKGDVLLVCKGSGYGAIAKLTQEKAHIARQFMALRCTETLDNTFNYYLAHSVVADIKKDARGLIAGIARDAVLSEEIAIPSFDEQMLIGKFLSNLDNLITLHQRKLKRIKEYKKGMLQKMFPKEGECVPEIRFPCYSGDWEQRKVGDVAPLQRGFDLPVSQMQDGKYPVVMSNGIGGYHSEYKVKGPGIVTGRSGTLGKLHYIEEDYWPHNTALWVTDFKGNYPKFIYYLYQKLDLSKFGSGSGVPTLNRNDVHDANVYIPRFEEQKQISCILTNLDNTITLHQRKIDELKELKKGLLQQMFV